MIMALLFSSYPHRQSVSQSTYPTTGKVSCQWIFNSTAVVDISDN